VSARARVVAWAAALAVAIAAPAPARAFDGTPIKVIVPDAESLQYLAFWLAREAGFFRDEGFQVDLVIPERPQLTGDLVRKQAADVAVLPPPTYLELIADEVPIVLVANLLQNDPIDLVVRRDVMKQRGLSRAQPVADRLRGIRGLRVGVAPNPPARLRALFASQGLDADRDIEMVILHGKEQNAAFAAGRVDALYAHTPYLETALVEQGAEMLVDQSGGEVRELSARQIHALCASRAFAAASPDTIAALTRAIDRAERLVHADRPAAEAALARHVGVDPRTLPTLLAIYEPAIPATPEVSIDGFAPALALFPASRKPPSLDGIDLTAYVAPRFAADAVKRRAPVGTGKARTVSWLVAALVALLVAAVGAHVWRTRRRVAAGGASRPDAHPANTTET